MLDDFSLPLVQDVRTREDRAWAAFHVPGLDGAAHQHLGRRPALITIVGLMVDDRSLEALTTLRQKFQDHEPMTFVADITTATEIQTVVIDDLHVTEVAGKPQQYRYVLQLLEFIPPPPPALPLSAPDLDAADIFDQVTDLLGELPGLDDLLDLDLINPVPPLQSLLDTFTATTCEIGSALQPLNDLLGS